MDIFSANSILQSLVFGIQNNVMIIKIRILWIVTI